MLELRRVLEQLMGVEPVAPGEDTQWRLRFALGWPDWVVVLFAVFAVALVVGVYLREGTTASRLYRIVLAALRLAAIGLVLVMLGGLEISIDRTGLPYLVLMVDDSESMSVRDRSAGTETTAQPPPTRLEMVAQWLRRAETDALEGLTDHHKLQLYAHASAPRLLATAIDPREVGALVHKVAELKPTGAESRLGSNLRTVLNNLRGTPPSAVVLITDGITTQGESLLQAAQYAARKQIPVMTIGVGDPQPQRDLELHDLLVDDTVFVDDLITFEAKLTGHGFTGHDAAVTLRQAGVETPLDQKTYRIAADGSVKVRLTHWPTVPGTIVYTLAVPPAEREVQKENNKIERTIRVIKEKIKVLLVETYPRYEFRYLKNLLEREATVELSVLLLDSDPEYPQQDRSAVGFFPTSKSDLFAFDVLILGDVTPALFSQAQLANIREFVRTKGGGLLLIAGAQADPQAYRETPLADLLPIEASAAPEAVGAGSGGYRPRLTLEGRASPVFRFAADEQENEAIWKSLPMFYWHAPVQKPKPAAQVLAEHPTEVRDGRAIPLVAAQFFGAGRCYFQAFDETWRWRYRAEDLYFGRYWVQVVRFLARAKLLGKSRSVELMVDRRRYERGEPVQIRARFLDEAQAPKSDDAVRVLLERAGYDQRPLELRRVAGSRAIFETVFQQSQDGKYRGRLTSPFVEGTAPTVEFDVVPPPGELDKVQMNEDELRQVAKLTGGAYFPLAEANELFSNLPPGQRVALHTDPPFPLWRTWPMLLLFGSLLVLEWVLRKRRTLL